MSNPDRTIPGEPLLERLGLGTSSLVELARRLAIVAALAVVLSAATFALVESVATATTVRRADRGEGSRRARWSTPELARAPAEIIMQIVIIGIAAFAGRKVLRLRL